MSDAVKWALLAAAAAVAIALICALPFVEFINIEELTSMLSRLAEICGDAFTAARGIINNLLTPFGRVMLSGLMFYLFGKWVITIGIKVSAWAYHFIFK